jgi:serine phosphatase RsbU (regulator of sigma subunit)
MGAYAIDDDAPAGVLRRLVAYHAATRPEVFPTVAYVAVDLAERRLTVVSLGHPMPLLLRRGAIVPMPDVVEPPLGVDVPRRFREGHVDLTQHDLLVLFTDNASSVATFPSKMTSRRDATRECRRRLR